LGAPFGIRRREENPKETAIPRTPKADLDSLLISRIARRWQPKNAKARHRAGPSLLNRRQNLVLVMAHVAEIGGSGAGTHSDQEVAIFGQLVVHVVA